MVVKAKYLILPQSNSINYIKQNSQPELIT